MTTSSSEPNPSLPGPIHRISVVVPVFQGEKTLALLARELAPLAEPTATPAGRRFQVVELLFVHDGAVDGSAGVIEALAAEMPFVRPVWLSRNYGQHPATLAGMSSSVGDFVVTLDEDGQQDPRDIGALLDLAVERQSQLVYADPRNEAPHGLFRNLSSRMAKWVFVRLLGNPHVGSFNSFRLIDGEIARSIAAFCGNDVYLDVALAWVVAGADHCPVTLRVERGRPSAYGPRRLLAHFWRLVLSSGTRPLRLVALMGVTAMLGAVAYSIYALWGKLTANVPVQGWTSLVIVICFLSGTTLLSLAVIAEYLGNALSIALGRPLFLMVSRPVPPRRR